MLTSDFDCNIPNVPSGSKGFRAGDFQGMDTKHRVAIFPTGVLAELQETVQGYYAWGIRSLEEEEVWLRNIKP